MEKIYKTLLEKYEEKQVIVAIEELSELQKELCKSLRGQHNQENIVEEISDVLIMIDQMKIYFGIKEVEIEKIKKYKIERTKERLGL